MVDDPPKKKRRKTGPKYGRRIRGKKLTATSPVPSAVEDINPALDDNVGPDPNVNDDHTIIVIRGSGPDNLHPAAERSDSVVDPAAEDAVMEDVPVDDQPDARLAPGDAHIAETRVSSKCGPSKTTNDKNKTIKSLRNKLYYQSHLRDAADDSVGVLKSEVKKLQDECKDLAFLESKAQAAASKVSASAKKLTNKLTDCVSRFSSFKETKAEEMKNVRKKAKAKIAAINDAKTAEIATALAAPNDQHEKQLAEIEKTRNAAEKSKRSEDKKIQVCARICHVFRAPFLSHSPPLHCPNYRRTTASRLRPSKKLPLPLERNARGRRSR